jgi:hypothetical protein
MAQGAGMQAQAEAFETGLDAARSQRDDVTIAPETTGRALVPVCPAEAGVRRRAVVRYPVAPFLAHLIAIDRRLPQTRPRGRAAPADAAAAYGAALKPAPARTGRRVCHSA